MRRNLFIHALGALALAAAASAPAQDTPQPKPTPLPVDPAAPPPAEAARVPPVDQSTPSFPAQIEQVIVDVVVVDKKGNPITDLRQDEVTISEEGTGQSIISFEKVELKSAVAGAPPAERPRVATNQRPENRTGRSFVILFDDVHLQPFQAQRAKGAVASFLENGTSEGDLVTLVASGGGAWWTTRMPQGRDVLIAMLKRLDGRFIPDMSPERMSDYEAMMIHVFRDQRTIERVNRRYDTFGVNPGGRQSEMSSGQRDFGANADPQVTGRAAETYFSATSRNRITLEVIERMMGSLRNAKGRKSMILVSEGFIYDPNLTEFKEVVQAARRSNVAIYFLDTRGLQGMSVYSTAQFGPALDTQDLGAAFMENLEASEGAESIAADSGGFTVKNTNDLSKGIQRIATESSSYYLVGYVSTNTVRDGKFRKVSVKVARKDVQVRARKGYYAPEDGVKPGEKKDKKKGGPDPVLQAALDSPFEEDAIPLRMASYVFDETLMGKTATLLLTDVDVKGLGFVEKDGRLTNSIDYLLVAAHRETGEYFQYNQRVDMKLMPATKERLEKNWYPMMKDFELPPGGYQAKMVVRDTNTGRVGSVVHEFEVPDPTKFRTSTPVVSDSLQPQPEGSKEKPRPLLLARRVFPTGTTVFCSLDVYGATKDKGSGMPRVSMGYTIKKSGDGTVVRRVDPTVITPTSLGKLSRMIGSPLEAVDPGEYQLVINVRDELSGQALELNEPFSLLPGGPAVADKPTP